jgi:hypothetical protein
MASSPNTESTIAQSSHVRHVQTSGHLVDIEPEGMKGTRKRIPPHTLEQTSNSRLQTVSTIISILIGIIALVGYFIYFAVMQTEIEGDVKNLKNWRDDAKEDIKDLSLDSSKIRERLAVIDIQLTAGKDDLKQLQVQMEETRRLVQKKDQSPRDTE